MRIRPVFKHLEPGVKAGDARAMRHRSRRPVDPYADVPVFTEDMPIADEAAVPAGFDEQIGDDPDGVRPTGGNRPGPAGAPGRYTAGERSGEQRSIPLGESSSAGRPQPTRKARSQRGKR